MTRPSRKTTSFAGWSSAALVEAAWVIKSKMVNEQQLRGPGEYDVVLLSFSSWIVRVMQTAWPKHECASTHTTQRGNPGWLRRFAAGAPRHPVRLKHPSPSN